MDNKLSADTKVAAKPAAANFDTKEIQHIIRLYNTNIDGNKKTSHALTGIKGIGSRFGTIVVARAGINPNKKAGHLTTKEIEKIQDVIENPAKYEIPSYFLNHQNDILDGTSSQLVGIKIDADIRMRIERGKKIKEVRALRLDANLKVRGQKTKSNGRQEKRKERIRRKKK